MTRFISYLLFLCLSLNSLGRSFRGKSSSDDQQKTSTEQKHFFQLTIDRNSNTAKIHAPTGLDFDLPDSMIAVKIYQFGDFNADNKTDVLLYLESCGTGGCLYCLFLNNNANNYTMAFLDYLNNLKFKIEKSGKWTIESFNELEPNNPNKIVKTIYKLNETQQQYQIDTSYLCRNKELEK